MTNDISWRGVVYGTPVRSAEGNRVGTVEEVLNKGDELTVRVVEVDRERGRIGLRLADDPEVVGKSVEELAAVGSGDNGPASRGRDRGDRGRDGRGGRDRDRDRDRGPRDRDRDRERGRDSGRVRDRDPDRPHS